MKKFLLVISVICLISASLLTACSSASLTSIGKNGISETTWQLYAPASTSSIPVILAANKLENVELVLYSDQSQANTLFIRGEIPVLVTGLSVGLDLNNNQVPISIVNTYVSGLSYLVTYGTPVQSLNELQNQEIYIPFEGSPIEEVIAYLAEQEGLVWKQDIFPVYSPFDASITLLKEGKINAVVLPEPFVSLVEGQPDIFVSLSLSDLWNQANFSDVGYPQVGTFVNPEWAKNNPQEVEAFNLALEEAITEVTQYPSISIEAVEDHYPFPAKVLLNSLERTHYNFLNGEAMRTAIKNYYSTIGKRLNENNAAFYYTIN
ncbi:MAG: hypothetical protein CL609_20475 [Anaerolineaceae bacterium]|nr:hypothetical protein [Anaerolineaceae bacterium]